ncbi:major facilitator superfamily domain-containing protein [Aspergillus similis]
MLQYMDKVTLGYATQLNLRADLYRWCSSVYYFGYLFWSWPSSYISVRFPLGKYLGASVALWARFFLGVTEAAVVPGFSLITGMFYKTSEQPSRMALWFLSNAIANIVSGCVTAAYGILLVFVLPDSPLKAWFLKSHERKIAVHRTVENRTGVMDGGVFRADQMVDALTDPQAWLLVGYSLTNIIINGFGFSELNSLLLSAPGGGLQILALAVICWTATYAKKSRIIVMIVVILFALVGVVLMDTLPDSNRWGRWAGIFLLGLFATSMPISLSLVRSNVGGLTKKATVSAMLFLAYCTGNIIGAQLFLDKEAPKYPTGLRGVLVGFVLANRRRERKYGPVLAISRHRETETTDYVTEVEFLNRTDKQIPSFRYIL